MLYFTIDPSKPDSPPKLERNLERWMAWMEKTDRVVWRKKVGPAEIQIVFTAVAEESTPEEDRDLWTAHVIGLPDLETIVGREISVLKMEAASSLSVARVMAAMIEKDLTKALDEYREALALAERELLGKAVDKARAKRIIPKVDVSTDFLKGLGEIE